MAISFFQRRLSGQLFVARRMGTVCLPGNGPRAGHQIALQFWYAVAVGQQPGQRTRSTPPIIKETVLDLLYYILEE